MSSYRELRLPDNTLDGSAVTVKQFQFGDAQRIAREAGLFDGALAGHSVVLAQDGKQAQCLQMMLQQQLRSVRRSKL